MAKPEDDLSHPRALLRPCLLLLLAEHPGHGYDLVERLKPLGFDWGGPGPLYQTLRRMEDAGLVRSTWDASQAGPARRVYELTGDGGATLATWAEGLDRLTGLLGEYKARYEQVAAAVAGATAPVPPAPVTPAPAPGPEAPPPAAPAPGPETPPPAGDQPSRGRDRRVIPFGRGGRRRGG
ncbi:MAG: helix-turn-helix transcriptional regulator [Acidimicrobiales bacterium]